MASSILIQMMGGFTVTVDGVSADWLPVKTPKGVSLIELLVLHRDEIVTRRRLCRELWGGEAGPECNAALKTLVCRTRQHLNQVSEGLGDCIATARSGYRWQDLPGVAIDVVEVQALCAALKLPMEPERRMTLTRRLVACYRGDLFLNGLLDSGASLSAWLHREYMDAIEQCLRALRTANDPLTTCEITAAAIWVDSLDERVSASRIRAFLALNRPLEARMEYLRVVQAHRRELGSQPSAELVHLDRAIAEVERRRAGTQ